MKVDSIFNLEKNLLIIYADYLKNIEKEITGVIAGKDIEYLHRMRVATRRLRALYFFLINLITDKKLLKPKKKIKKLTTLLGPCRETDIKLEYLLRKYAQITDSGKKIGIKRYICLLDSEKKRMHSVIKNKLNKLIKQNFFLLTLHNIDVRINEIENLQNAAEPEKLQKNIDKIKIVFFKIKYSLEKIYEYSIYLNEPKNTQRLHQLRIKIKKLRYMIEILNLLFENLFDAELQTLKELQTVLGDIHDADVWINNLPFFLKTEKKKMYEYYGNIKNFGKIECGINHLVEDCAQFRNGKFAELLVLWENLKTQKLNENIQKKMEMIFND